MWRALATRSPAHGMPHGEPLMGAHGAHNTRDAVTLGERLGTCGKVLQVVPSALQRHMEDMQAQGTPHHALPRSDRESLIAVQICHYH